MNNSQTSYLDVPDGWTAVLSRAVLAAVVVFATLQVKEFIDVGAFDTPGTATDAGLIAGATLVVNAILMWIKS